MTRRPTYDGSLWGPDVCRCSGHVDPHRHTVADPYGRSIYAEDEPEPTRVIWRGPVPSSWVKWPRGYYPLVGVPENTGKHPTESDPNGEKWAILTTVLVCFGLAVTVLAAAAYAWLR